MSHTEESQEQRFFTRNVCAVGDMTVSVAENTFHTIRLEVDMPVHYEDRKE